MDRDEIHSVLVKISTKIDKVEALVQELNIKLLKVEKQMEVMQTTTQQQPQVQVAMVTSISTTEEKIKLLNEQTNSQNQEDLLSALKSRLSIDKTGVLDILDQKVTIYDYVADVVYEFDNESTTKYFYGFSDSKNTLYYWNHSKKTWAKVSKSYLLNIFMEVQQQIMFKYNELMNHDQTLKKGCVENGDLIFADDFEKKHVDFKKYLISKFI